MTQRAATESGSIRAGRPSACLTGLVVVLGLAALLRFGGIMRVGIRYWDEGAYARDARLWHRCARVLTDTDTIGAVFRGDKAAVQRRMEAVGVDFSARYAKPSQGYTFLGAAMMFVVGDGPEALLVTNALCGTLTVWAVYGLGAVLFSRRVGLCAALLLAVSPYHLVYCRTAMAETPATLFVVVGVWLWAAGRRHGWPARRTYGLSGLALGVAITCHYRSVCVPVVLGLVDLWHRWWGGARGGRTVSDWRVAPRAWGWWVAGATAPVLALESVFRAARLAARVTDSWLPVPTFLEGAWQWWAMIRHYGVAVPGGLVNWAVPVVYAGYFAHWHGGAAVVLAVLGLVIVMRVRGDARAASAIVWALLGVLLLQSTTFARAMAAAVPFICLCLAVAIGELARIAGAIARRDTVAAVVFAMLLAIVAGPSFANAYDLSGKRSHLADACRVIAARAEGTVVVPPHRCLWWLYLEKSGVPVVGGRHARWLGYDSPEATLAALRRAGVRWVVTDSQWLFCGSRRERWRRWFEWSVAWDQLLRARATLVAEFPHLSDYRWEYLAEGPGVAEVPAMARAGSGPLRIYDISVAPRSAGRWGGDDLVPVRGATR